MKKLKIFIITMVLLGGCSEEFLTEDPKGQISPDSFYNTEADLLSGLNAVYNSVGAIYIDAYHVLGEQMGDLTRERTTAAINAREFPDYFGTSEGRHNLVLWQTGYELIANTNAVIENLVDKDIEETLKSRVDAEARFFRALMYYYLVNFFGEVPLIVSQIRSLDDAFQPKASADDIYSLILSDLVIAKANLPEKSGYSGVDVLRPSKGAARILLAKVSITRKQWSNAGTELQEIISSNLYGLEPNYKDIWKLSNNNLNTPETIMEIYFPSGELNFDQRSVYQQMMLPQYFTRAFENVYASDQLIAKFDTVNDTRYTEIFERNSFMGRKFLEAGGRYMAVHKWLDIDAYGLGVDLRGPYENNWILFRYADVLLLMAEVLAETGGSVTDIEFYLNLVRSRAGVDDLSLAGLTKDDIIEEIFDERARELYMEGHRVIDLKNRGGEFFKRHVEERLGTAIPDYKLLVPIPLSEVQANPNVPQNPGY